MAFEINNVTEGANVYLLNVWNGMGYQTLEVYVYADSIEGAIDNFILFCEKNPQYHGYLVSYDELVDYFSEEFDNADDLEDAINEFAYFGSLSNFGIRQDNFKFRKL